MDLLNEEDDGKYRARVVWGTEATPRHPLPRCRARAHYYDFHTQAELDAFLLGVNEADGWMEARILQDDELEWQITYQIRAGDGEVVGSERTIIVFEKDRETAIEAAEDWIDAHDPHYEDRIDPLIEILKAEVRSDES